MTAKIDADVAGHSPEARQKLLFDQSALERYNLTRLKCRDTNDHHGLLVA
jgi:hypothetical protein